MPQGRENIGATQLDQANLLQKMIWKVCKHTGLRISRRSCRVGWLQVAGLWPSRNCHKVYLGRSWVGWKKVPWGQLHGCDGPKCPCMPTILPGRNEENAEALLSRICAHLNITQTGPAVEGVWTDEFGRFLH